MTDATQRVITRIFSLPPRGMRLSINSESVDAHRVTPILEEERGRRSEGKTARHLPFKRNTAAVA